MKNALLITRTELVELVRNNLEANGFYIGDATVRISSTGATVVGAVKKDKAQIVGGGIAIVVALPDEGDDEYEDEYENDEEDTSFSLSAAVLAAIAEAPMTIGAIAEELNTDEGSVRYALQALGGHVESVAPARRDGQTVSCWMKTGTTEHSLFVAAEAERIDKRVEELTNTVLVGAPKFYERRADRMEIVNGLCGGMPEADAENLRRDNRAVFYRMEEKGLLEHQGHGWRAAKSDKDKINVSSLQGAVREVLIQSDYGLSRQGISEKLPGFVDDSLLRHAIKRMDDVVEQGGMYSHNG